MKMVEIKCPSCGGKLKVEDSQTKLITCEYCGSQFLLDDEKVQHITNYNIYQTTPSGKDQGNGAKIALGAGLACAGVLLAAFILSSGSGSSSGPRTAPPSIPAYTRPAGYVGKEGEAEEEVREGETAPKADSPLFHAMTWEMFQKEPSEISPEDLAGVRYLKVETSLETDRVWYSFDDPYSEKEPVVQTASFGAMDWEPQDAAAFTGLVKLDLGSGMSRVRTLKGLKELKGITAGNVEISGIKDMLGDPAQITELQLKGITSMEGIASFENLERLTVRDYPDTNLKQLVPLKRLNNLSLEDTVDSDSIISTDKDKIRVKDYSAISVMSGLKSLYLNSDIIKDIGFIKGLPALEDLTLEDTAVISLASLSEMPALRSLTLLGNNKVQDFGPVGTATGLTSLSIDKMTSQPDPDLSSLSGLEKLDIKGFMSIASVRGLSGLKELSIHNCNVDQADALSSLTGVERLTFYSVWNSQGNLRSLDFLKGMTGLKYADFTGNLDGTGWSGYNYLVEVYGDVSSIFNHQGLEELYLDNGKFEINFDKIKENPGLRVLSLRNMELHKNYYVESYGGMTSVWYDDVKLGEHMDILSRFPNLEELYLDSNELTDLNFAAGLKNLKRLGLKDNYITDLSPLKQAEFLEYLDIRDNPVGEVGDVGNGVEILQ
ncbi:leucine-rich repeat domain-containing protein [Enterocloster bolteae]|uniref:leucine-rich repeat domain-containing protein n=1 Tax=Enterocloster bolteae TaxID=208479 RepID=UPI00189F9497|nr:leucine-rich repeat domain-containing protein [Enterocloster bolteae]